jgi:quinohemoprotein ethanol dehydrogenase
MTLGRVVMLGALAVLAILIHQARCWLRPARAATSGTRRAGTGPYPAGDWGHTRYSTLTQINPAHVKNLQGAWMTRLNGSGLDPKTTQEGTPIVRDGVMYLPTANMDIFAVNAKTGAILWEYVSGVDPKHPGRWANRGVDVAEGKVFAT